MSLYSMPLLFSVLDSLSDKFHLRFIPTNLTTCRKKRSLSPTVSAKPLVMTFRFAKPDHIPSPHFDPGTGWPHSNDLD